jgi:hypothetical protein
VGAQARLPRPDRHPSGTGDACHYGFPGGAVGLPVAFAVGFPGGAVGLWVAFPAATVAEAVGDGVVGTVVGGADVGVGAVVGRLGAGAGGTVVGGPVVGCWGRMITASAVPGEPGVGLEAGLGLDAEGGANGRLQSDGPPSDPVRTATPMEPRKNTAVVVPDHAAARVRNSLRPESSTKTGEPVDLSSGVDAESARTFPLRTGPC